VRFNDLKWKEKTQKNVHLNQKQNTQKTQKQNKQKQAK